MAHAMAPKANLILVEVPSFSVADLLAGVQVAAGQPGVVAVSVSYGGGEFGSESTFDATYLASAPVSNVVVTFSTGDSSSPEFPATSPNVVAVGGTSLYLASARGKYSFETAWGGLSGSGAVGGGTSTQFATPGFQANNGVNFGHRRRSPTSRWSPTPSPRSRSTTPTTPTAAAPGPHSAAPSCRGPDDGGDHRPGPAAADRGPPADPQLGRGRHRVLSGVQLGPLP